MAEETQGGSHQPCTIVCEAERPWELLRWPWQWSKMLVHPTPERPTSPNAGLVRYEPGSHHPFHKHEFAQVWYEDPLHTDTGGLMLFVQYQGPTTGGRPIYEGRFNMTARKRIEEENVEV